MVTIYNSTQENQGLQSVDELNADMSSSLEKPRLFKREGSHENRQKDEDGELIKEEENEEINHQDSPVPKKYKNFSDWIIGFLNSYNEKLPEKAEKNEQIFQVSEVLGGLARLYERIRTTVEYKGEHVLRRNAIERILRRLVWEQLNVKIDVDNKKVAESLIKELIWARYLPNGKIPKSKVESLEKVIEKYTYFLKNLDNLPAGVSATKVRVWIWGVASSEIEDLLDPSFRELYVILMYEWFKDSFIWNDLSVDEHSKNIQIYLAVHRAFTKSDESIMRFHLLLKEYKNWRNATNSEINKLILQFPKIYIEIESHINYSGRFALYRRVQKYSAAFEVFREIAKEEKYGLVDILKDKDDFEDKIREVCDIKYKQIKQKVSTGIIRSIIYIFITKVVFGLGIEIPYEILMYGELRYLPLSINMAVPPLMMWIIGLSIKIPGTKNTQAIIERLESVVYKSEEKVKVSFSVQKSTKNSPLLTLFALIYSFVFFIVFGSITYLLSLLNYSLFGIIVFFIFLSLVMLFAYRVRYNASQMKIDTEKENIISHLTSYITLPFLNFGFYLSKGLSKINFFTVILDFLIEVPLKNIIEIFEEWTSFIKEKKEEVIEMPE